MKAFLLPILAFGLTLSLSAQEFTDEIGQLKQNVEAGNYFEALGLADKLIASGVKEGQQSQAAQTYFYRAESKRALEMNKDAITDYRVALSLNPELTLCNLRLAEIYYDLNQFNVSLENAIYFLQENSNDVRGLSLKARCLLELDQAKSAKIIIQEAISAKSSEPELYYIRAAINHALGDSKLACQDANIAYRFGYEKAKKFIETVCENE